MGKSSYHAKGTLPTVFRMSSSSELSSAYSSSPGTLATCVLGEGVPACCPVAFSILLCCSSPLAPSSSSLLSLPESSRPENTLSSLSDRLGAGAPGREGSSGSRPGSSIRFPGRVPAAATRRAP